MPGRIRFTRPAWMRRFAGSESGTATIESVIWMPVFFGFLVLVADVSMIFNGQARMLRIVQDTNRSLSVGRLTSKEEAMARIRAAVADIDDNPEVSTVIEDGIIRTRLVIPSDKLDAVGLVSPLMTANVVVTSEHFVEY